MAAGGGADRGRDDEHWAIPLERAGELVAIAHRVLPRLAIHAIHEVAGGRAVGSDQAPLDGDLGILMVDDVGPAGGRRHRPEVALVHLKDPGAAQVGSLGRQGNRKREGQKECDVSNAKHGKTLNREVGK